MTTVDARVRCVRNGGGTCILPDRPPSERRSPLHKTEEIPVFGSGKIRIDGELATDTGLPGLWSWDRAASRSWTAAPVLLGSLRLAHATAGVAGNAPARLEDAQRGQARARLPRRHVARARRRALAVASAPPLKSPEQKFSYEKNCSSYSAPESRAWRDSYIVQEVEP